MATTSTGRFGRLPLDKFCLASRNVATCTILTLLVQFMLLLTPRHDTCYMPHPYACHAPKVRETFADGRKSAKVFSLESFPLYGSFQVVASTIIGEGEDFSPSRIFSTEQDGDYYCTIRFSRNLLLVFCISVIVSTSPRSLIAEYASMETTSSTALQLMWDHPLCM